MTQVSTAILLLVFAATAVTSCKKGEGDSALSLKSRKARVTGEWTIDSWVDELTYSNSSTSGGETTVNSGTRKTEITGTSTTMTESVTETGWWGTDSYNTTANGSVTATMKFEKDGTFSRKIEYRNVVKNYFSGGVGGYTVTFNRTLETTGTWNFLGGIEEDYKNKERIVLNVLEDKISGTYTDSDGDSGNENISNKYENGEFTEVWQLSTLKNKEMVIEATKSNTGSSTLTENWGGTIYSDSGSSSETGTLKGTLIQK